MTEYILNYMEEKGQYMESAEEETAVEKGIRLYLEENGIDPDEQRSYFRKYVDAHLKIIDPDDLKVYFIEYDSIRKVRQIAIEQDWDGCVSKERVAELYKLMTRLNNVGLGDKYIPVDEVKIILGKYS